MNILVEPKNNDGSIEHYYHFLFGYLFPFIQSDSFYDKANRYFFFNCGEPMNRILRSLSLDIVSKNTIINKKISCLGFDKCQKNYKNKLYTGLNVVEIKNRIFFLLGLSTSNCEKRHNEILLVERDRPCDFFLNNAKVKGSGSSRRSVPNINEIAQKLDVFFNVKKIILENLSLRDQIIEFNTHKIIILQHGAAMSNLIWSEEGSIVFEITSDPNYYWVYNDIIKICNLRNKKIIQKHDHAEIGLKNLISDLGIIF